MKIKKIRILLIVAMIAALTLIGTVPSFAISEATYPLAEDELDGDSIILMDAKSGEIIYEKNAHKQRDPASMTKILNCLVVLDTLDLDQEVTIDRDLEEEGTVLGLEKGRTFKVKDLVYAMMVCSANDAAEMLAYEAGGSISNFCDMMNAKAKEYGAEDTKYNNPNGLNPNPDGQNNLTTAYDVAVIVQKAMQNPDFAEIVNTERIEIESTDGEYKGKGKSSNYLLWNTRSKIKVDAACYYAANEESEETEITGNISVPIKYEGCIGVKTGYSSTAGDCFAGFASRGDTDLISVVMHASSTKDKFRDTVNLFNYGFANYKTYTVAKTGDKLGDYRVKRGTLFNIDVGVENDLSVTLAKDVDGDETISTELQYDTTKAVAPIEEGTIIGKLVAHDINGDVVAEENLVALESVEEGGPLSYIWIADEYVPHFIVIVLAVITLILIIIIARRMRKKKQDNSDV